MTRAGNATNIAITFIFIAPTPNSPTSGLLEDLNFGNLDPKDLNCRVRAPPEFGGPHDTAGKLCSDLGRILEAPRLQMSHPRRNGGAAMCSHRITVLPLGAGVCLVKSLFYRKA